MDVVIHSIYGNCPVQADGTIGGIPFYFRARSSRWSMSIGYDPVSYPAWYYTEPYGNDEFAAGYMTQLEALGFIVQALNKYVKE